MTSLKYMPDECKISLLNIILISIVLLFLIYLFIIEVVHEKKVESLALETSITETTVDSVLDKLMAISIQLKKQELRLYQRGIEFELSRLNNHYGKTIQQPFKERIEPFIQIAKQSIETLENTKNDNNLLRESNNYLEALKHEYEKLCVIVFKLMIKPRIKV